MLSKDRRRLLFLIGFLLIVVWTNFGIYRLEKGLSSGTKVVLKLRPADPRSLLQGDYMRLGYSLAAKVPTDRASGTIYLLPDANGYAEKPVPPKTTGATKLNYRVLDGRVLFGIESFFFQEGTADRYLAAKYVELRVSPEGVPSIITLLDEQFKPL